MSKQITQIEKNADTNTILFKNAGGDIVTACYAGGLIAEEREAGTKVLVMTTDRKPLVSLTVADITTPVVADSQALLTELAENFFFDVSDAALVNWHVVIRDEFVALNNYASATASSGSTSFGDYNTLIKRNSSPWKNVLSYGSAIAFIPAATASSRAAIRTPSTPIATKKTTDGLGDYDVEMAVWDNNLYGAYADDPFIGLWGLLSFFDAYPTGVTTHGIYFRNPYTTETAFFKACIMNAGVETTFDTTIPFVNNSNAIAKFNILWDSVADEMIFKAEDANTLSTVTVSSFSTSYTSCFNSKMRVGIGIFRNGAAVSPPALQRVLGADYIQIKIKKQW